MFTTSPIFGLDEDFSGSRPAVGDVARFLQLSRVVRKGTTGCSQVLVNEHLVTSTCVAVLELKPGAVHVISHLLTGESDYDSPMTRFAVLVHLWSKTVALDLILHILLLIISMSLSVESVMIAFHEVIKQFLHLPHLQCLAVSGPSLSTVSGEIAGMASSFRRKG